MKIGFAFFCILILCISACFSPLSDNNGSITLSVPGQSASRSVVTDSEASQFLRYDYIMSGPGKTITGSFSHTQNVKVSVIPGKWTISINAYGKKYGDQIQTEIVLRGTGITEINVRAGQNTQAIVPMVTTTEVTSWNDLVTAVAGTPYNNREEVVIIKNNLTATSSAMIDRKITILTDGSPAIIQRDPGFTDQFFYIDSSGYLALGKAGYSPNTLQIDGNESSMTVGVEVNKALITMYSGGTLIMNDGVTLKNNYNNYTYGGGYGAGVEISKGTFIMNGGLINNNKTLMAGAGVCINASLDSTCTFTMNGGSITGNSLTGGSSKGGGIYLYSYSGSTTGTVEFILNNGIISGNTAISGGGVYYEGARAIFTQNGGTIIDSIYNGP
jgi:hypothetical protein